MSKTKTVVFAHGMWLHSSSWNAWVDYFNKAGYQAKTLDWPGDSLTVEASRNNPGLVANKGLKDIIDYHIHQVRALPQKPIIIGHSFGGLITEALMAKELGIAGIAIDAAPIKGVLVFPPSALRVASVVLKSPFNIRRAVMITPKQFRYGFANAVPVEESDELYQKYAIPSPARPIFEASFAALNPNSPAKIDTANPKRGPLLLTSGGKDNSIPTAITQASLKLYKKAQVQTDFKIFADRGHSLIIDHGWQEVADYCLDWLKKQGL